MAIIQISTILNAPISRVWEELNRPQLLDYVSRGMVSLRPIEPETLPEIWEERDYKLGVRQYGWLPVGWQVIKIERPRARSGRRFLRDNGHGKFVKQWDHLTTLEPVDDNYTRFTDRLDLEAGIFTGYTAHFARKYYAYRQNRWAELVASGFDYGLNYPVSDGKRLEVPIQVDAAVPGRLEIELPQDEKPTGFTIKSS